MLQRTHQAIFLPGFYVFPGGAVDASDHDARLYDLVAGQNRQALNRQLGIKEGGLAYLIAAIRECYEESGILLTNLSLPASHPALQQRQQVASGQQRLLDICQQHDVTLDLSGMAYLDHWITPPGPPRRFDTRFFIAKAPEGQQAHHDNSETIDSIWLTPQQAIERFHQGQLPLILPTLAVLKKLENFTGADEAIHHHRNSSH